MPWLSATGNISLYGLSGAGPLCDRGPDAPRTPGPKKWPEMLTLEKGVGGSGQPFKVRERFEAAFALMERMANARTNPGCDRYFESLSDKKLALSALLTWKILIFRYGSDDAGADAKAMVGGAKYAAGTETLAVHPKGPMLQIQMMVDAVELVSPTRLAATLVHELAHVAGAPGRPSDDAWAAMTPAKRQGYHAAEDALKHCGFPHQHNPDIYGEINRRMGSPARRLA